ncbi:MAG TPA: serine hydrolase, partial [Bacteroidia bacterium]|nr:serine hydrolase [Bacteroidia bacterium]
MKRPLFLTAFFCLFLPPLQAEKAPLASLLAPFVEKGELAGAVALVANATDVVSVECVGYADL